LLLESSDAQSFFFKSFIKELFFKELFLKLDEIFFLNHFQRAIFRIK